MVGTRCDHQEKNADIAVRPGLVKIEGLFDPELPMLDAFIIQELKRREQERQRQERQRPVLEIPTHDERERRNERQSDGGSPPSTVVHIDI